MQVEIWSDVVCPWCYLGKRRFERALSDFEHRDDVEVVYRSFELEPDAPHDHTSPTVETLSRKYGMTPEQAEQAQRQMEQRAAADDLVFRMGELRSGNTRDAHRLLHLARARGRQAELAEALHRAYFTEQRSVFEHAALADVAEDEQTARALGITGVPFFVIDRRYGVSGAQPVEVLSAALEQAYEASLAT